MIHESSLKFKHLNHELRKLDTTSLKHARDTIKLED